MMPLRTSCTRCQTRGTQNVSTTALSSSSLCCQQHLLLAAPVVSSMLPPCRLVARSSLASHLPGTIELKASGGFQGPTSCQPQQLLLLLLCCCPRAARCELLADANFQNTGLERSAALASDLEYMQQQHKLPAPVIKEDGPGQHTCTHLNCLQEK